MGEPSSGPPEGTPRAQISSMLSIYLERSQSSQSQTAEPEQTPVCRSVPPESAYEAQLRQLGPAFGLEAVTGGAFPEISGTARTSQSPFLRSISQTIPPPQTYVLPQQPETAAAPASISAVSSAISLSSLPREPGGLSGYQHSRCACPHFSPLACMLLSPTFL